jgi:hypothetical protein
MFIPLKELSPNPRFGDIGDLGEMGENEKGIYPKSYIFPISPLVEEWGFLYLSCAKWIIRPFCTNLAMCFSAVLSGMLRL